MRRKTMLFPLIVLIATCATAQPTTAIRITGISCESAFFNFSYTLPPVLRPDPLIPLAPASGIDASEQGLFYTRQNGAHLGVTAIAEKLHAATPRSSGLRDGNDFLDKVAQFRPEQHAVVLSRKHLTNASGVVIDVLNYTENGAPSSAVAAQIGDYLIVFKCDARSAAELDQLDRSVFAIKHAAGR